MSMGLLVRLDAPYVGMFKRAYLIIEDNIRIEVEKIRIAEKFIEIVKKTVGICKDAIANVDPEQFQFHTARKQFIDCFNEFCQFWSGEMDTEGIKLSTEEIRHDFKRWCHIY